MKIKLLAPTAFDVRHLAVTVPPQDVVEPLGSNRLVFDLEKGGVSADGRPIENYDALIGLGTGQALGVYELLDVKLKALVSLTAVLPEFMPRDPERPGFFRLTVVDGVVMSASVAWKPEAVSVQALADAHRVAVRG